MGQSMPWAAQVPRICPELCNFNASEAAIRVDLARSKLLYISRQFRQSACNVAPRVVGLG